MSTTTALIIGLLLLVLELIYFRIAKHYNIIDRPNHRSSHSTITVRGGGVIFCIGLLVCPLFFGIQYPLFLLGLFLISLVSFIDDVLTLNNRIRLVIQLLAALLMMMQLGVVQSQLYYLPVVLFIIIGVINAVNFMDGINGITGIYALVTLTTLYYLNLKIQFAEAGCLLTAIIAVAVFGIFNFRTKARCFAGDVGSVSIAFIITFFLLQLIIKMQNISFILLLSVYGLDTVTTIFFRVLRKENITQAHRSHFYQFLANEKNIPHIYVAVAYGVVQLIINILVINTYSMSICVLTMFIALTFIFLFLRFSIEGKKRLLYA